MILEEDLIIANKEAVNATEGTEVLAGTIDLGAPGVVVNGSHKAQLVIVVGTPFVGAGASVQFNLRSDDSTTINASTSTLHYASRVFPVAELSAGARIVIDIPTGIPAYERYLGLTVVTSGATTTAGTISAFITMGAQEWRAFPEAVS